MKEDVLVSVKRVAPRNVFMSLALVVILIGLGCVQLSGDVARQGSLELIVDAIEHPDDCRFDIRARLVNRSNLPAVIEKWSLDQPSTGTSFPSLISIYLRSPNGRWNYVAPYREIPPDELVSLAQDTEVRSSISLRYPFTLSRQEKPIQLTGEMRAGIRYFDTEKDWKKFKASIYAKSMKASELTSFYHEVFSKSFFLPSCSNIQ